MKDGINLIIIILAIIILALIGVYGYQYEQSKNQWNNGYCSCGGHWKYEQAVDNGKDTVYVYRCEKCGETIEVGEIQDFVVTIKNGT